MDKKIVLVIADSLGVEQFRKENMPFLHGLGCHSTMSTCLGFSISILPSLYTGVYPDEHRYFTKVIKSKCRKSVRALLMGWMPDLLSRPINYLVSYAIGSRVLPSISLKLENNFKMLDFDFKNAHSQINDFPTIFDFLTHDFQYVVDTNDFKIRDSGKEIDVYYTIELDRVMHLNLKKKEVMKKTLQKIDNKVKEIYGFYSRKYDDNLEFFVVSDHGQAGIEKRVDVLGRIKRIKSIKEGKHYLMFSDSTMARFWVNDEDTRKKIICELRRINEGKILDENELKKLHVKFKDNRYGDIIFLMEEHNEIYPSHFHMYLKSNVQGLHGYHPDCLSMKGVFLYKGTKRFHKEKIDVVDVAPSILTLFGKKIPETMKGKSIW